MNQEVFFSLIEKAAYIFLAILAIYTMYKLMIVCMRIVGWFASLFESDKEEDEEYDYEDEEEEYDDEDWYDEDDEDGDEDGEPEKKIVVEPKKPEAVLPIEPTSKYVCKFCSTSFVVGELTSCPNCRAPIS